jgi:hypothetical protein
MSQFFLNTTAGPIPPFIPTQFTADDATIGVPVANNFNLFSNDTSANNDNGIQTTTVAPGSANHFTQLTNRITGIVTTTDATITSIISFPLGLTPGTYYVFGNVQAFGAGPNAGAYSYSGGYITDGVTATELGTEFHDTFETASMLLSDIFLNASANNCVLSVQGLAGSTIDWNSIMEYRRVL